MQFRNLVYRSFSVFLCLAIANLGVPESPLVAIGRPIKEAIERKLADDAKARNDLAKRRAASKTRPLTEKETSSLQGRTAQCPYIAGASKWDPSAQGVDLITGNYSMSATDLSFDGGYGIPVNVTRSYSANDANEGPFGYGWTLSADVRTTAGGILKSKAAPIRSVPTTYKERAAGENDPNLVAWPVEAVTAEDASGKQETIQKDADGVLSPAAWDQNQVVSQYQSLIQGGYVYQVLTSQTTTTPEGTTYVYQAEGSYQNGGTVPYNNSSATPTPANVLKCVSATDRNGNTTTYTYGSGTVQFNKIDGVTQEHPLVGVAMPNGHTITLSYGTGTTANRIVQVWDNNKARVVNYAYDSQAQLTGVTSPAGLTTNYGYGSVTNATFGDTASHLITSITDPRGLATTITYFIGSAYVLPYEASVEGVMVNAIVQANGVATIYNWKNNQSYQPYTYDYPQDTNYICYYEQRSGGLTGTAFASYYDYSTVSGNNVEVQQYYNHVPKDGGFPAKVDDYDVFGQSNTNSYTYSGTAAPGYNGTFLAGTRNLNYTPYTYEENLTSTTYNFLGKPLDVTAYEYEAPLTGGVNLIRQATTSYAYWDATKYYQQKATLDPGGRVSFTDYYTATDSNLGNRGQTYEVFDPKYGLVSSSGTGDAWRHSVTATAGNQAAQFLYDSKGRATTVYKLQAGTAGTPTTYRCVTTQTTYGADTDGSWGQASQVVEDAGGINRTTKTLGYTSWGKADDVIDAAGHEFQTTYDGDGKVLSVTQVGVGPVATYAYGTSGVSNGQVLGVTDNLSGVSQSLAYQTSSGGGLGQVQSVTEVRSGATDNVASYTYNGAGDRLSATYRDGQGNLLGQWGYYDYIQVGDPAKGGHAFQTLNKLDGSFNRTSEEFHYAYDNMGRILEAAFAQTPQTGSPDANGYYDGKLAQVRARAHYEYDAGGRLYWIAHYWDTLSGSTYNSEAILAQGADYEINAGLNRGLKTDSKYYTRTTAGQSNWTLAQTDSYSYDPALDYLTGANYGDGQANATPSWSYDAAGNRNDAVTDNLNRATSLGGVAATNDILGNRLTLGSKSYGWDQLNRMTSYNSGTVSTTYTYRADGMRTYKSNANGATSYRYDGQMGIEDIDYVAGAVQKVTNYGIGARGIDALYVTQSGSTSSAYPIYDAHGNMISTLSRQGLNGYAFSVIRSFDAWGNIRIGAASGDPKGRYCANLGHKQDDESGLVYMRARYYDLITGRFLNEDTLRSGHNWFSYCRNNPIFASDRSGKDWDPNATGMELEATGLAQILGAVVIAITGGLTQLRAAMILGDTGLYELSVGSAIGKNWVVGAGLTVASNQFQICPSVQSAFNSCLTAAAASQDAGAAAEAVAGCAIYGVFICAFLAMTD